MLIFKGLLYRRTMKINTRKILISIGLLIAFAGWPFYGLCESITIRYNDTFSPAFPEKDGNPTATTHTDGNFEFGAAGIYKGNKANYLMFASGKGYLYNTESLGHIDSVIVSYSSGVAASAKFGVYFADTTIYRYTNSSNTTVKGKNQSDTVTNTTQGLGYFQLSTSSANCQIVSIKIVYTQGNTPIEDITPPTFSTNYPKTENSTKSSFDLKVKASEPCTVFYQVAAEGGTAPTKDDLLASVNTITIENGNTEYSATISELESETTYNIYLIAKDTADNVQENVTTISATTLSAVQKIIALRDIEEKYYWGETANIKWSTENISAATELDSIILFKANKKISSYPIDITSGEADILIGNGTAPNKDTYATNYSLKVVSGNVESERSENFTIVPLVTINQLLTDTTNKGAPNFKNVRVKGIVTGTKSQAFTIQDGSGDFCATYVTYSNTGVSIGDSVYAEGVIGSTNGMVKMGSNAAPTIVSIINSGNQLPEPEIVTLPEINTNKGLTNLIVRIDSVVNINRVFYKGKDSIVYANYLFSNTNNLLKEGRKHNITGAVGIGTKGRKEIWPRSEVEEDIYLYSNDTTLANFVIDEQNGLNANTLFFKDLTTPKRISVATNDNKAKATVMINDNVVDTADLQLFNPLDSVFVTVKAEDESEHRYKVVIDQFTVQSIFCTIGQIKHNNSNSNPYIGKFVTTNGTVTFANSTAKNTELYIQDSAGMWSGIMVIDTDNKFAGNTKIGDKIQVTGRVTELPNSIRIEDLESLTITQSGGKVITDTIIVEDALSTAYQNAIVTIDSVVCTDGFDNLFSVSDSTNSILIYNKYRISDFALEIDSMYRITGIVYYTSADNSYRIIPRSADDIVKLVRPQKPEQTKPEEQKPEEQKPQEPDTTTVGISGTNIGLTAYTIGRTIVVENADATVTVFDIAGRLIATARPAQRIAISAPHSGIYIVGTRQGAIKVRVD